MTLISSSLLPDIYYWFLSYAIYVICMLCASKLIISNNYKCTISILYVVSHNYLMGITTRIWLRG
jgi:hypothetical protein